MTQNFDPKSKCRPQWYFSAQKSCQAFLKDKSSEGGGGQQQLSYLSQISCEGNALFVVQQPAGQQP